MNILVLCHDVPSPTFSENSAAYYLIKGLSLNYNHEIKLLCLDSGKTRADNIIKKFIEGKVKFNPTNNMYREILYTTKNMFSFSNLKSKFKSKMPPNVLDYYYYYYSPKINKKIKSIIKKSDILLLLSKYENYGAVIPEALAMKTPVIVTNKKVLKKFLNETGCFFRVSYPPKPKQVAELISKISRSDIKIQLFTKKIKTWKKVADKYEKIYYKQLNRVI